MDAAPSKQIWTIGHSTHPFEDFVTMLKAHNIEMVVDVRRFPGSRRWPQYSKETLKLALAEQHIDYLHSEDLGGRRSPRPDSKNSGWRVLAFRGYADYMETPSFQRAAEFLEELALRRRTVYMCSEAVWWSCHRSLISDWLKFRSWTVQHIMSAGKVVEHPWTKPARISERGLEYTKHDELPL